MKKTNSKWPKVSLVLLTLNGGEGTRRCLESVKRQVYPKSNVEVIVIDNGSKDNTVSIAKSFGAKVDVSYKNAYENRATGMRKASGEFVFLILEHDLELKGKYFLQKMTRPLLEDSQISASFTRDYPKKDQPWVTRFISHDPIQRDPLFEFLTPSIESTITKKMSGYYICDFNRERLPPVTHMLYRVSALKKTSVWKQKRDYDHDTVLKLARKGFDRFAYVPSAGTYHHHASNLKELIGKRLRNLENHYFPHYKSVKYSWVNQDSKRDILRLFVWVLYANLIFPAMLRGIWRYLKFRDWALLLEPIITVVTTDAILWKFTTSKYGRKILAGFFKTLIS